MATSEEATVHPLPTIGKQLVEAGVAFNSAQYRVVKLAAELDASDEWLLSASSASRWIATALDIAISTAREWIRVGRALRHLPEIEEEFASNRLSYSKVRTLTRIATVDNETEVLEIAMTVPASRQNKVDGHADIEVLLPPVSWTITNVTEWSALDSRCSS